MNTYQPFQPRGADQTTPTAQVNGGVTASVTQINLPAGFSGTGGHARFCVQGADPVAWAYGSRASLSLGNGVFMLPNSVEVFSIPPGVSQISVISSGTASTMRIVVGDGV
jgi:hypothetical protein